MTLYLSFRLSLLDISIRVRFKLMFVVSGRLYDSQEPSIGNLLTLLSQSISRNARGFQAKKTTLSVIRIYRNINLMMVHRLASTSSDYPRRTLEHGLSRLRYRL